MSKSLKPVIKVILFLIISGKSYTQLKIGDNVTSINTNSILELESTNKGFVLPRISLTSTGLSSPLTAALLTGTVVYNTNSAVAGGSGVGLYYWDGTKWNFLINATNLGGYWALTGNSGTTASTAAIGSTVNGNFIGTIDSKDFVIASSNLERLRVTGGGNIGIRTISPKSYADVAGSFGTGISSINSAKTLDETYSTIVVTPSSTYTITLPSASSGLRRIYKFFYNGSSGQSNTITIAATGTDKIMYGGGNSSSVSFTGGSLSIQSDGTNWYSIDQSSYTISKNVYTVTLPNISNNSGATTTVTVPGALWSASGPNSVVVVNPEQSLPDGVVIAYCYVSATDTITIVFRNATNKSISSQAYKFDISIIN